MTQRRTMGDVAKYLADLVGACPDVGAGAGPRGGLQEGENLGRDLVGTGGPRGFESQQAALEIHTASPFFSPSSTSGSIPPTTVNGQPSGSDALSSASVRPVQGEPLPSSRSRPASSRKATRARSGRGASASSAAMRVLRPLFNDSLRL